jgi:oligoribonuclease (3'-5' exoribonuclease)
MYQSALTAITEQETNRAADKIAGLREQVLMNEGVMDYVRKAGQSIKAIARKVFEFIQQTVMNTAKRIAGRFIKFVRRAADKGLDALMEFFGYEVEGNADVQIQF